MSAIAPGGSGGGGSFSLMQVTQTYTATGVGAVFSLDVGDYASISLQIDTDFNALGDGVFEASNDNSNWFTVRLLELSGNSYTTPGNDYLYATPVLFRYFRFRCTSFTSSFDVTVSLSTASATPTPAATIVNGSQQVNLRNSSGTEIGTSGNPVRADLVNPIDLSGSNSYSSGSTSASSTVITSSFVTGVGMVYVQVSGTWSGTLNFEGSVDGSNWTPVALTNLETRQLATSTTSNGLFAIQPTFQEIRLKTGAMSSGTVATKLGTGSMPIGTPALGVVSASQSGTWHVGNITGTVSLPTGAATAANQTTIIGHVDGIEGTLSTISGNVDGLETTTSAIQTSVQLLDDVVATAGSAITSKGNATCGSDGTNARILKTDTSGNLTPGSRVTSTASFVRALIGSGSISSTYSTALTNSAQLRYVRIANATNQAIKISFNASAGSDSDSAYIPASGTLEVPFGAQDRHWNGNLYVADAGIAATSGAVWIWGYS